MLILSPGPVEAAVLLLLLAHFGGVVFGLQCYICIPRDGKFNTDVTHIFPDFPKNLVCEDFHPGGSNQQFIRQCPEEYKSCLIETRGSEITRTCGESQINDCKSANNVQYCYCSKELCNQEPKEAMMTSNIKNIPTDDEDQEGEGSGAGFHGATTLTTQTPNTTVKTVVTTPREKTGSGAAISMICPYFTIILSMFVII